ncbi:MAG: hypothetical protein ACJ71K_13640 [Nitrososphaeraceae archaeon]|jgi:hypothetical protein
MSKDDILSYIGTLRKPDPSDPLHKWIGTYIVKNVTKDVVKDVFKATEKRSDYSRCLW